MTIAELLRENEIVIKRSTCSKNEAIDLLIGLHNKAGDIENVEVFKEAVLERESRGSTAVGKGIAISYGVCACVKKPGVSVLISHEGVDYDSLDGKLSHIIFMLSIPEGEDSLRLDIMLRIMVIFSDAKFYESMAKINTVKDFIQAVSDEENEKYVKWSER